MNLFVIVVIAFFLALTMAFFIKTLGFLIAKQYINAQMGMWITSTMVFVDAVAIMAYVAS